MTYLELLAEARKRTGSISSSTKPFDPLEGARIRAANYNRQQGDLDGVDCPTCLNKGQFMVVHDDGSTVVQPCSCMAQRRSLKILQLSGLTDMVNRLTFDSFEVSQPWQQKAKETALKYAADPAGKWFLFSGQPGSGKTHLCTAVCNRLMKQELEVRYILWRDTVARLKACVTDSDEYQSIIEPLKSVRVLYLDDFLKTGGRQSPTTADINAAFEIVNYRYNLSDRLTIISTEWTPKELLQFDEALGSRLLEKSVILNIAPGVGKNYRLK